VVRVLLMLVRAGLVERRRGAIVLTDIAWLKKMIDEASETD